MLNENINSMIMTAMKSGEKDKANVYRLIKNEFLKFSTAKNTGELNEAAEITILQKMVKQREESIANYKENEVKNIKASLSFRERKRNKLKRDILEEGMESYYKNKNNDVKKQTHIRMKVNSLENAFMMNESNIIYPKLFLPRDNSGLLNIPTDMLSSKKKTKGTKSKSKR
jgi:hypothetical protein